MAAPLPAQLKTADVQRFATRAAQLEKFRPIVTYWLEYYILQQILNRGLHNESAEVAEYAGILMDKIEAIKEQYASEPAVTDDDAAKAYMEQFANETFSKAEAAQSADKVTKATADSFQAAATFFDALAIFGEQDAEIKQKIKFAKFHALRIVKALHAGTDPNESNPKVEPLPEPAVDDVEQELKEIEAQAQAQNGISSTQPTVEPASPEDAQRSTSIGGGYFPSVPAIESAPAMPPADIAREVTAADIMSPSIDNDTHIPITPADPASFYTAPAPPPVAAPMPAPIPTPAPAPAPAYNGTYNTDDDAVMAAQKHAKWAISALNFEDVPTAIKELRIALQALGGL